VAEGVRRFQPAREKGYPIQGERRMNKDTQWKRFYLYKELNAV